MQLKPAFGVIKGINQSVPPIEVEDYNLWWAKNVYFREKKIKERNGFEKFGTEVPLAGDPVLDITQFVKYDGTDYLCAITTKNIYNYNKTSLKWDLVTNHLDVCDCEDQWTASANVTSSADDTIFRYGAKSAKHIIADAFTTGLASYRNLAAPLDLSGYTYLYFYIRSSKVLAAGDLQILLDDTNGCVSPIETLDIPAIPITDTWYEFGVALATPASCGAIASIGLNVVNDVGAGNVTIYLDQFMAVKALSGSIDYKIQTEQIYDDDAAEIKFIVSNGVDNIQKWNGTGNFADLGGTPNKARLLRNFNHYLLLLNTTVSGAQAPQRIEWPVLGKPEDWSGTGSGNNSLAGTSDFIVGCEPIGSNFAILKETSISLMSYVGSASVTFEFEENKVKDIGCAAEGSIQNLGTSIIFLGWDNVYVYDGFTAKPIGDNIVTRLIDELNPSKLSLVHSHIFEEYSIYCLHVPSASSDYPDFVWVLNYEDWSWTFWKFSKTFTASGFFYDQGGATIGSMLGTMGSYTARLGSKDLKSLSTITLYGDEAGYIYKYNKLIYNDDGVAIDAYIDTKSEILNGVNNYAKLCQFITYAKGNSLEISISTNDGTLFVNVGTITLSTTEELACFLRKIDITAERFMIRMRNNTLNEWFQITGWEFGYLPKTRNR